MDQRKSKLLKISVGLDYSLVAPPWAFHYLVSEPENAHRGTESVLAHCTLLHHALFRVTLTPTSSLIFFPIDTNSLESVPFSQEQ